MLCQRQSSILSSTVEPRTLEELEGALLDPRYTDNNNSQTTRMTSRNSNLPPTATAIAVDDDEASSSLIHAIPVQSAASRPAGNSASPTDYFEYSKEELERDELLTTSAVAAATNSDNIPVAPTLTGYEDNSPEAQAIMASAKTRIGSDIGRVNAIEEKEKILAISRMARSKPYHEKARIQAAGTVARQRVREGFDVKDGVFGVTNSPLSAKMKKEAEKQDAAFVKKGGGYEVSEYETKDYDCNSYNGSGYEYKSVYD